MLLLGSRAIKFHVPSFREPKDWDLLATDAEIDRLKSLLPLVEPRYASSNKTHFLLDDVPVEVQHGEGVEYWSEVLDTFRGGESTDHPVFGKLDIAPLAFVLISKHCSLCYPVLHWHKNLEDLYYLRQFVTSVSPEVERLAGPTASHAAWMRESQHRVAAFPIRPCHPKYATKITDTHLLLHEHFRLGSKPRRELEDAWLAFPGVAPSERRELLIDLLAEEAMVLAAESLLIPDAEGKARPREQVLRWVVRNLAVGSLPPGFRYFVVNYYHEIMARIRPDWFEIARSLPRIATIEGPCRELTNECVLGNSPLISLASESVVRLGNPCTTSVQHVQ